MVDKQLLVNFRLLQTMAELEIAHERHNQVEVKVGKVKGEY